MRQTLDFADDRGVVVDRHHRPKYQVVVQERPQPLTDFAVTRGRFSHVSERQWTLVHADDTRAVSGGIGRSVQEQDLGLGDTRFAVDR